jgi:hypothetical protein
MTEAQAYQRPETAGLSQAIEMMSFKQSSLALEAVWTSKHDCKVTARKKRECEIWIAVRN